ncbi:MAG: hypothetical protein IPJ41_05890 [Phycisphaerales bacterium]|nr:hypothetical protein [Phycisphaerales bacterium]
MAKNKNDQTSKGVASKASKLLSEPKTTKAVKAVAASALTQTPRSHKSGSKNTTG